jgi:hypothetical protein
VSGKATNRKSASTTTMVPKGSAAVDCLAMAVVFSTVKQPTRGAGNTTSASMTFHTQFTPLSCRYRRADMYPPTKAVREYRIMRAATMEPRRANEKEPSTASVSRTSVMTNRWTPAPIIAVKRFRLPPVGKRKTSPWMSFQPCRVAQR